MSQITNENIMEWVQIFVNASSPNEEILKPANDAIIEKMKNEPPFFIGVCTQILMINAQDDNNYTTAKCLASIFLTQMLHIQNPKDLEFKRQNLSSELIESIKMALRQNIFSNISTIRNKCAQCYSILFAILTDRWPEGVEDIVNSFNNMTLLPYGFIGLISIMREIVTQKMFVDTIAGPFEKYFTQTLVFSMDILSKEPSDSNYTAELRIEACRYIHDLIFTYPQILDDNDSRGARIPYLLQSLPNSFQISNIDLFSILHQVLFVIVKRFYSLSPNFMETVASYVGNGFDLVEVTDCVNISIYFWKEIASLEENIIEKHNIDPKKAEPPLQNLLSEIAIPTLIPILIHFMESINENDTAVEDVQKKPEPSMFATVTIGALYKILPRIIFDRLKDKIEEDLASEKWTIVHAGILMIYSIAEEPTNDIVGQFIAHHFEKLLESTKPDQFPRLRETALFVIGLTIKNYPQIITQAGEYTDMRINQLIESIEPTLRLDEQQQSNISYDNRQIFIRYASIIYHLSAAWKNNQYDSHISQFFDKLYEIIGILFNFGIMNSDQMLLQNSSEALNQLIFNSTSNLLNKLEWLYQRTLNMLVKSKGVYCAQEIRFLIQSSFCSNISTLLLKLRRLKGGFDVISKYTQQTITILYDILSNRNTYIYEEALMAISALISATNQTDNYIEVFDPNSFHQLLSEFVKSGLTSLNSGVINATCLLIGNLFYFLSKRIPDLNQYIPVLFSTLTDIIMNNKDMRDAHPFILKAIADIFKHADPNIIKTDDLEIPLRELLTSIYGISVDLEISEKNDVEYGNLFYQYLTDAFCGYARVFYNPSDPQIERNQLFLLDKLATYIFKLNPKIKDNLYKSFMEAAREFANNCSRKNNVILNRHSVHRILKLGYENVKQPDLRKKLKEASDYLKSK